LASSKELVGQALFDYLVWRVLDLIVGYLQSTLTAFQLIPTEVTWQTVSTGIVAIILGYCVFYLLFGSEEKPKPTPPTTAETYIDKFESEGQKGSEFHLGPDGVETHGKTKTKGSGFLSWRSAGGESPKNKQLDKKPSLWRRLWSRITRHGKD
jgi:hypothetical protein